MISCFLLLKFKNEDVLALVRENKINTPEELVEELENKNKKRHRSLSRSQSRSRSRSISSILKNRTVDNSEDPEWRERGRKKTKISGDESRMMTRSRSRAALKKSVRIESPNRLEQETLREDSFDEPFSSTDIPQSPCPPPPRKSKQRWSLICEHCGE